MPTPQCPLPLWARGGRSCHIKAAIAPDMALPEQHPSIAIPIVLGKWQVAKKKHPLGFWKQCPRNKRRGRKIPHRLQCANAGCFAHLLQLCLCGAIFKQSSARICRWEVAAVGGHFWDLAAVAAKILSLQEELHLPGYAAKRSRALVGIHSFHLL